MEKRFGTFNGVFLPTFLTIVGVIYFLRLGWVVGNSGLIGTIAIIIIAHIITISTALSMSAITTNMKVKGGGAYYLISRSLGLEVGGSIGITLYLSQAISVALYVLGFIESVEIIFPGVNKTAVSIVVALIIGAISIVGADFAIKAQYFIFGSIILAVGTVFISGDYNTPITYIGNFKEAKSFWVAFSIFFPAVTGILAGVSMSGDLKNPRKNIPRGTFLAIGITFIVYILQTIWFSLNVDSQTLMSNKLILISITKFPYFIILGIWAATLSSALGSIVAAPRTMQALAKDGVLPKKLGKGSGAADEPRIASIITFIIAFIFIIMGNLDVVAPIITMFFLNTYGAVNLAAGLESVVGNPSYRPTFKVHWSISLVGALGSYWVMFLINKWATIISLIVTFFIYLYLSRKQVTKTWGDLRGGIWIALARFALLKIRFNKEENGKNWKPDIIVFSGTPRQRQRLVYLSNLLTKGNGIVTLVSIVAGGIKDKLKSKEIITENLKDYVNSRNILAFQEVIIANSFKESATAIVQANGIGTLKPNTVLLGFSEDENKMIDYVRFIGDMIKIEKNIIIFKENAKLGFGRKKRIDIWWGGLENNGNLMLMLAHVISLNEQWKNATINIKSIVMKEYNNLNLKDKLKNMFEEMRIDANIELYNAEDETVIELIHKKSNGADLVVMGLAEPIEGNEQLYIERLNVLSEGMPTILFVKGVNIKEIV
ncbi:amino acid permease [Haliovirga abyssi]|uniref:Na-K-Cl cotransporter n=1 Tax=Haliovirga abyssi TaxID=2996794 RepID=A0AAU9DJ05_9FUSO|nr:amino acid permease [Haliovirga abyssi]BDU50759.1 Na-K-Cl cotransporter [Haliovirga abyssi]